MTDSWFYGVVVGVSLSISVAGAVYVIRALIEARRVTRSTMLSPAEVAAQEAKQRANEELDVVVREICEAFRYGPSFCKLDPTGISYVTTEYLGEDIQVSWYSHTPGNLRSITFNGNEAVPYQFAEMPTALDDILEAAQSRARREASEQFERLGARRKVELAKKEQP